MAGSVRLAVTGIQDQWLTGEPQFSYFVMNYRRHTRFSTEMIERPFEENPGFGKTLSCRIPKGSGDLLRSVTLKVTLEPTPDTYNTSIGTRIIEYADLVIGGQTVERLTGEYMYMYDQLHNNLDETLQTLYFLTGHNNHLGFSDPYTFYVNIPFYFFRHPSLAIPLCAITKQLVEIRVKFKSSDQKITYAYEEDPLTVTLTDTGAIKTASFLFDLYFVTEEERAFLMTRPVEYVITQLQLAKIPFESGETARSVMLHFQHPVKELYFIAEAQELDQTPVSDSTLYRSEEVTIRSDTRWIKRVSLEFNEATVFDHERLQLAYQQSLDHHTGCPSPAYEFYTYSFALKPEEYYPTGQVNMSRVRHQKLNIELVETDAVTVSAYAVNYNVLRIESGLAGLKF
jgi:hypothetical protein